MASVSGNAFDYSLFKRTMKYVKPYRGIFYVTAVLSVVLAFMGLIKPLLIQYTIDDYIKALDEKGLLYMTLVLIGILVAESIFQYFFTTFYTIKNGICPR